MMANIERQIFSKSLDPPMNTVNCFDRDQFVCLFFIFNFDILILTFLFLFLFLILRL